MSRLSQMIVNRQREKGLRDREVAGLLSEIFGKAISQQTYNAWKKGRTPTDAYTATLAQWLDLPFDDVSAAMDEARASAPHGLPSPTAIYQASQYGKIADRKEGKYRFEAYNMGRRRVPEGRYMMSVDTKIMEPIFHVGTRIWIDPTIAPLPGHEVVVHADGYGWLGVLRSQGSEVILNRPGAGAVTVKNVEAVHVVVLSSRI